MKTSSFVTNRFNFIILSPLKQSINHKFVYQSIQNRIDTQTMKSISLESNAYSKSKENPMPALSQESVENNKLKKYK